MVQLKGAPKYADPPTSAILSEVPDALRDELYALHARFCQALGDPKRLLIIAALRDGELSVGELTRLVGARQANVSQHLALMRHLGIAIARRVDNNVFYRLSDPRIVQAIDLLRAVQADQQRRVTGSLLAGMDSLTREPSRNQSR